MLRRPSKRPRLALEGEQGPEGVQAPQAMEEEPSSSSSTCSSSSSSTSSTTSSSCSSPLLPSASGEVSAAGKSAQPQSPPGACGPTSLVSPVPGGPALESESAGRPQWEGLGTSSRAALATTALPGRPVDYEQVSNLVQFLLAKYRAQEPASQAEMLWDVLAGDLEHFTSIFQQARQCLQLVFGLDLEEVGPEGQRYVLTNTLGLTYDRPLRGAQSAPKTSILILMLSIIFIKGNRASEEQVWEALEALGLCEGSAQFIYGELCELLTQLCVRERYLEYRQVPGSHPARYEFLWGPRAHAETSKMKVLQFLARLHGSDPRSFPLWYEDALRDEQVRAQLRAAAYMISDEEEEGGEKEERKMKGVEKKEGEEEEEEDWEGKGGEEKREGEEEGDWEGKEMTEGGGGE